jgi:aspartate aminotransferase-like enzyme
MNQEKLLLIPGPTPVHPKILNALSQPTLSHVSPVFVAELKSDVRTTESKFEAIRSKRAKEK